MEQKNGRDKGHMIMTMCITHDEDLKGMNIYAKMIKFFLTLQKLQ